MAKKRAANGINMSEEIRKVLDSGVERGAEIKDAIKKLHNIDISDALIGNVKSRWKKQKGGSEPVKRGRKPKGTSKVVMTTSGSSNGASSGNGLQAAVQFIRSVGGIEQAKQLITTIEDIKRL